MSKITLKELMKTTITKQEIAELYGISEREARRSVKTLAEKLPVIAVSSQKGYKIATSREDEALAKQAYCEILSRIKELSLRARPLKHFCAMVDSGATTAELHNHFEL